ncbi:tripartite tricarboxylate transporter substrate binding protein [uncultured Ramlibacter sp.]|uniref:Bug family tripartite tricarboxylate transporter substrate binding protein n=1 Tax=uncultured Ramlibacter sp. TaxID=260755 RepID=UPI00261B748F|nr:tripartite tricarboxylate transporter substrate binding protein [uncultured Ramlibacter sp.]
MRRRTLIGGAAALPVAFTPTWALAQAFPSKPVRIVVPFGPGGIADLVARAIAQKLGEQLRQSVVVENKPGAGGVVAGDMVAKAEPDGHTLLLMSNGTAVSATLFQSLPFNAQKDFAPVATLGVFDIAVLTAADSRFKSMKELLAYARANPGKLNMATINVGSSQHLSAELLKTSAGVDFQVVPFNGSPAVLTALRGGQVDAAVEILGPMLPQIAAKAVQPLAVMGARRAASLPDVPTMVESGVAGFDVASWNALAAPARTPPAVVAQLNREVNKVLADPGVRKQLADLNVTPRGGTPEQLGELLASETRRWADVIIRAKVPRQ